MASILITGATGFIGGEIVRLADAGSHRLRILARSPDSPATRRLIRRHPGIEVAPGNLDDADSLNTACRNIDTVIHLVGIIREFGPDTFESVHRDGVRRLAAAAREQGVQRWIHMSALGARPDSPARYHQTKWAGEETVRSSGIPWTIFRPSIVYGPRDEFINFFDRMASRSPVLPLFGGGHSRLQPIQVTDVARAFVGAVNRPESIERTWDLVGRERLSFRAILETLLRVTQRRRLLVPVPWSIALLQARILEAVFPTLLRQPPPLTVDQVRMLREDNIGDAEPAASLFNLELPPLEQGLRSSLARDPTDAGTKIPSE